MKGGKMKGGKRKSEQEIPLRPVTHQPCSKIQ